MPTRTWSASSTRAHSWDFRNFRSPGISLMSDPSLQSEDSIRCESGKEPSVVCPPIGVPASPSAKSTCHSRHVDLASTVPYERILHRAQRQLAATDVHTQVLARTRRHARECHRSTERRRKNAGEDFAFAFFRQHTLAMPQHALVFQQHADQFAGYSFTFLLFQRVAADEIPALVQRHGPGESGFPRRDVFVHVLTVKIHAGFQPQRVAR